MKTLSKKPFGKAKTVEVLDVLEKLYPDAGPELDFKNNFELLIATVLSAQCTDKRVNAVTEILFAQRDTPEKMVELSQGQLQEIIKPCGLYQTKAANILRACHLLLLQHGGQVPGEREALMSLPGVGRKTASVVLSNGFGIPAIAVDTHVLRVSNRIGLAVAETPDKTEVQLMKNIPKDRWSKAHHLLIFHGRRVCKARKPDCDHCPLVDRCRFYSISS